MKRVYLDHAATSPLLPEVRAVMSQWLDSGNASALYQEGRAAKAAVDEAREAISEKLCANFPEVVFTSSGTESAAMAIIGPALAHTSGRRRKIVISGADHHCSLGTRQQLERLGFEVLLGPVDRCARLSIDWLRTTLKNEQVLLVAAMHANNELGAMNPVAEIGKLCRDSGTLFFCDAVQTFGKLQFTPESLGADLIALSGHKLGGPKGVGGLYIRPGTPIKPILAGGGQERELRGGTENVAAIAGFGEAVRRASPHRYEGLRPRSEGLENFLCEIGAERTIPLEVPRLAGHVHVRFPGILAETLLILLDRLGVSAGSGAACASGSVEPSHVLMACGLSYDESKEGMRFTLGLETSENDLKFAQQQIETAHLQLRHSAKIGT